MTKICLFLPQICVSGTWRQTLCGSGDEILRGSVRRRASCTSANQSVAGTPGYHMATVRLTLPSRQISLFSVGPVIALSPENNDVKGACGICSANDSRQYVLRAHLCSSPRPDMSDTVKTGEYRAHGEIIYDGQFCNGAMHGKGRLLLDSGDIWAGQFWKVTSDNRIVQVATRRILHTTRMRFVSVSPPLIKLAGFQSILVRTYTMDAVDMSILVHRIWFKAWAPLLPKITARGKLSTGEIGGFAFLTVGRSDKLLVHRYDASTPFCTS